MAAGTLTQQTIDWSGIRAAAVTVGVREAARQAAADMPEDQRNSFVERVMKRSSRQGWIVRRDEILGKAAKNESALVRTGADSISNAVAENCLHARTYLSQAALTGSRSMAKKPGSELASVPGTVALRNLTAAAAQIGGWDADKREGDKIMINIGILGQ